MEKLRYDFSNPTPMGVLSPQSTREKIYSLTKTQNKLRQQGHMITFSKIGLGFTLEEPIRRKSKKENVQYNIVKEIDDDQNLQHTSRVSVFNRIRTSSSCIFVFIRLGDLVANEDCSPPCVGHTFRKSAFKRLGTSNKL